MHTFEEFGVTIEEDTLSNGTPVLLFQKKTMPIHIKVSFFSGSRFDPKGQEGLAHFVEHMLVAGSEKFPSKDKLAYHIENIGGIFGAVTSPEIISLNVEVATKSDFGDAVIVLNEMINNALFDEKTIDAERSSIEAEIEMSNANQARYMKNLRRELFYQETDYGRSILGSKETVGSIMKKNLFDYYDKMLNSGRASIVISGDISSEEVVDELETGLRIKKSDKYSHKGELPIIRDEAVRIKNSKRKYVLLNIGFRTSAMGDDDTIPLRVLSNIFISGRASVFNRRLRYESGLVYNVSSRSMNFSDGGAWIVETSTSANKVQRVVDIIFEEFMRISTGGVNQEELDFAISRFTKSTVRHMQTSESWARFHAKRELVGLHTRLPDYLNAVEAVTLSDLARVGKKYFKRGSWYLAMCGNVDEDSVIVNY